MVPSWSTLSVFAAATFVLVATPGPGVLYVVGRSVDLGRGPGFASMLGIEAGEAVYIAAAAIGLGAVIAKSAHAIAVLHYAGAAYLVFLAFTRWRSGNDSAHDNADDKRDAAPRASSARLFGHGFVVQLLNPKVAIFFVAYFPQFIDPQRGTLGQAVVLGVVYLAIAIASDSVYVVASARLGRRLTRSARARRRTARAGALSLLALGVFALVDGNHARRS
jgi:threonine/homoserine/homoserine lactone efflux protein